MTCQNRQRPGKVRRIGHQGFLQFEAARTTADPEHWSKLRARTEIGSSGRLGDGLKWKLGARADYDFAYAIDFYPPEVDRNQRRNIELRETIWITAPATWISDSGKQHVVWGEMVGLFFADVVSARDMREFILPNSTRCVFPVGRPRRILRG